MRSRFAHVVSWCVLVGVLGLVAIGLWQTSGTDPLLVPVREKLPYVMSTDCTVIAVVPADRTTLGEDAIEKAEAAVRDVQVKMNPHVDVTELAHFNAAPAGDLIRLSEQTLAVLRDARRMYARTLMPGRSHGAFDVTVRPLLLLWKNAAGTDAEPTAEQIEAARAESTWQQIDLLEDGAIKRSDTACVDLGGIAKGYAIDRALEAMRTRGVRGGLVNIGGDVRCFGPAADGGDWKVKVRSPFAPSDAESLEMFATLSVRDRAVCTSGNYHRGFEIAGKRYSHILDPDTGRPADLVPSVTVVAPTATEADAWATALSVLGIDGLLLLRDQTDVQALIITGTPDAHAWAATDGFEKLFAEPPASPRVARGRAS